MDIAKTKVLQVKIIRYQEITQLQGTLGNGIHIKQTVLKYTYTSTKQVNPVKTHMKSGIH